MKIAEEPLMFDIFIDEDSRPGEADSGRQMRDTRGGRAGPQRVGGVSSATEPLTQPAGDKQP
jgi:hypothetical protein